MSDKKFDDFVEQSFRGYSPDVPPHIWENITAKRERKRAAGFWNNKKTALLLTGLALAGSAAVFFTKNNIAFSENGNTSQQYTSEKATAATITKDNQDLKTGNAIEDAASRPAPEPGLQQAGKRQAEGPSINSTLIPAANNTTAGTSFAKKNNKKRVSATIVMNSPGRYLPGNNRNLTGKPAKRKRIKTTIADAMIDDNTALTMDEPGQDNFTAVLNLSKEKIALLPLELNKQPAAIKPIPIPGCPKPEDDAAGNKSYWEIYAGPDYAIKKYSDTGNSELISKRKETMKFQSAFSAGFRYTKVFGSGISIRAGVNYSQINEKFSFLKDNVVQEVYVINAGGDTTDRYFVRGTRYSNTVNRYRSIDVPVTFGYEMGNGRLHANINAGVMINIYSWQSGKTLDNNYMPVDITTGKSGNSNYQYKTNVGIGFTGAVSLYYKLTDNLHLLAEPYGRFNLSPMNKAGISVHEKFTSIGLRLGIRKDF